MRSKGGPVPSVRAGRMHRGGLLSTRVSEGSLNFELARRTLLPGGGQATSVMCENAVHGVTSHSITAACPFTGGTAIHITYIYSYLDVTGASGIKAGRTMGLQRSCQDLCACAASVGSTWRPCVCDPKRLRSHLGRWHPAA